MTDAEKTERKAALARERKRRHRERQALQRLVRVELIVPAARETELRRVAAEMREGRR